MVGDRDAALEANADGIHQLRDGDVVKFKVKVAQDTFVGVWSVNADGTVEQLFPNAKEQDHSFRQDKERVVPLTRAVAAETQGGGKFDWIWVQASTRAWAPDEGVRKGPFLLFNNHQKWAWWNNRQRAIKLDPEGTLAEAVLKFRVVAR
jgi:hypothetical protein